MSVGTLQSADKNIVEHRRGGNAARKAVRLPQESLSDQKPNDENFVSELLQHHANLHSKRYIPIITVLAILGWLVGTQAPLLDYVVWLGAAFVVMGLRFFKLREFIALDGVVGSEKKWVATFNVLQAATGLLITGFVAALPNTIENDILSPALFVCAMALIGSTVITSYNLRFGVLITALPGSLVLATALVMKATPACYAMAVIVVLTTLFCEFAAGRFRGMTVAQLHSEVVRDQLIVDLEAATAISDEARRRAEEANLAKSRFLATMSHELRTPLNAILGFSEVMSNEVMGPLGNDHYKEYVGDIHRSGSHLLKLINEILDLSRVEAGRYEMNEEPVNLTDVVDDAQQMMKLKAKQKHISIVMQVQPDLPDIMADNKAVRQIVLNLLSNALKFTPDGGTIWMKAGWTAGGGQYISIKDSGPGIPEDEIPVVLSSFGQGSIAIKSAEQGTGLGLPIVQALVHMHQGHFELKSKLREGTIVIATFPRTRVMETMKPGDNGALHQPTANAQFNPHRQTVTAPPMVGIAGVEEQAV